VERAFGGWTTPNLKGRKAHLHKHAIQLVQQFSHTAGNKATDSSLIIDAMDLLHSGQLDGFVLVSSDSDFARLAPRLGIGDGSAARCNRCSKNGCRTWSISRIATYPRATVISSES
jgi:predicted nuclease of predicted toxin-antitoxin system